MTNSQTTRAIERLTEPHTEMTESGAVDWPPLLLWLEQSVTEIVGRSGGSSGVGGVPFNTEALELLNYLRLRYRMMCEATYTTPATNLITGVARLWDIQKADRAGGRIDDDQWEHITGEFIDWVHRIEAEDDRPHKMELTVPCPRCGERWVYDEAGQRTSAIRIELASGSVPTAECSHPDCGAIWAGWQEMALLGYTVGAEQNLAVLRACGIELQPELITTV